MPGPMGGPHGRGASQKPRDVGKTFARLLGYLKLHKLRLFVITVGLFVSAGAGVAGTYMLKPIINDIGGMLNGQSTDLTTFFSYLGALAAIYLIGALTSYVVNRMIVTVSTDAGSRACGYVYKA